MEFVKYQGIGNDYLVYDVIKNVLTNMNDENKMYGIIGRSKKLGP